MLDNEKFKALIGISENYEMPEKLIKILENKGERERIFTILADHTTGLRMFISKSMETGMH